jgi:hypothetical protein
MRHPLVFLLLIFLARSKAQIVLSDQVFPVKGDSLLLAFDYLPPFDASGESGSQQNWDFSELQVPYSNYLVMKDPRLGKASGSFANADFMIEWLGGDETYYKRIGKLLVILGEYKSDPLGFGIKMPFIYDSGLPFLRAGLTYGESFLTQTSYSAIFSSRSLPPEFKRKLNSNPDSLRIVMKMNFSEQVDGWGQLKLPEETFQVLRMRTEKKMSYRVEAKTGKSKWQDVSALLIDGNLLNPKTLVNFHYLSNKTKWPVIYTEGNSNYYFKSTGNLFPIKLNDQPIAGMNAFPNPAIADVRFEFNHLPKGTYKLTIFNIIGVEVWSKTYKIDGYFIDKFNVSGLKKGTYHYSLTDENGRMIFTKRLIVIKP